MQDFTGVPCVVDLATMREAVRDLGGDPARINPLNPAEMVIDHSVQVDVFGREDAFERNVEFEYGRNHERYQFLQVGPAGLRQLQGRAAGHRHRAPGQHRAPGPRRLRQRRAVAYPDTCVGTDSHTTMQNGLGVLGWGVGGIEAEAAMLGQPISMLIPRVVGFKLTGELPAGTTATDLVLTITEMLRKHGVVGKFVEFYGDGRRRGAAGQPRHHRQHEPRVRLHLRDLPDRRRDGEVPASSPAARPSRSRSSRRTPRSRASGTTPATRPDYSEHLELDLSTVVPSIAGPKRPQDRIALVGRQASLAPRRPRLRRRRQRRPAGRGGRRVLPGLRLPGLATTARDADGRDRPPTTQRPVTVSLDGAEFELDHGAVVIAAITSCTNTSNPSVMIGAALLAKKAVERGLTRKPWVKTSLAPGSKVVMDYYDRAGLTPYLEKLGFNLVGYGCTTCIGNSGPLPEEISKAVNDADLAVTAVLSGNRNFEGRINPDVKMNYLASPPLVVAYALAGSMDVDIASEPARHGLRRRAGVPQGHLAVAAGGRGGRRVGDRAGDVHPRLRRRVRRRAALAGPAGAERRHLRVGPATPPTSARRPTSTAWASSRRRSSDIHGAKVLALLGDSVTTDHISPAGAIKADSPAGRYLTEHGVERRDFNSYGSRRGNHEVMIRGTFANIRLRNLLAPGTEGGVTRQGRRADVHLRRRAGVRGGGHAADRAGRQGVRLRLVARLGGQGHQRCSAYAPCWPSRSSASTARTSSAWASCRCSSRTASRPSRWA